MSVLKNRRKTSKMEYVANGFAIEQGALELVKRMSVKNARLLQDAPIRLAALQADAAYMANEIYPTTRADYELRTALLKLSTAALHALDHRMATVYELLMLNPAGAFERQNGKPMDANTAKKRLDDMAENLGTSIDKQDALLKGIRDSDREKAKKFPGAPPDDGADKLFEIMKNSAGLM